MKPKHIIVSVGAALIAFYFLAGNAEKKAGIPERKERITVITATSDSQEFHPDMESYRAEKEQVMAEKRTEAKYKPEFKNAPAYKYSALRDKVPAGPIDDFGAPMFMPSENAITDSRIFEQEYAKHKERSDSYFSARMDEMKVNTEIERKTLQTTIETAKASGTKSPEEIKRAEDALLRMQILEKVLKGEKVDKILD